MVEILMKSCKELKKEKQLLFIDMRDLIQTLMAHNLD